MTTNNHTDIPVGAPVNAATVNAPLGQLDAAIASVIATGSGFSTTLTAQANAASTGPFAVASTSGLLAGDPVYFGTGATFESRIVLAVTDGTHFTTTVALTNTYAIGKPVSKSPVEIVDARSGETSLKGRLDRIALGAFNPKAAAYGAKGDGVADDTAALQACITAAFNTPGGTVVLEPGTYKVTATLVTPADTAGAVRIIGFGRPRSFTAGVNGDPAAEQGATIKYTPTTGDIFLAAVSTGNKRQYITIEDVAFLGNVATGVSGHGLHFQATATTVAILPSLQNVTVNGAKQHGVFFDGNVFEAQLFNVRLTQNGDRGFKAASNSGALPGETRFFGCSVNNNGVGIDISGGGHFSIHGLTCSNNTNEGLMAASVLLELFEANVEANGTAAGNQCLFTNMTGFLLIGINMTVKVGGTGAGMRFVNCLFGKIQTYHSNSSTGGAGYKDIVFEDTSSRCTVEDYVSNDFVDRITFGVGGGYRWLRGGIWQSKQVHNVQVISSTTTSTPAFDATLYDSFRSVRTVAGITVTISPTVNAVYHNGQRLSVQIYNNTAGATTTTFSGIFHLAGAWVDPAAGKKRTILFEYDDAIGGFIEISRSAADIT